MKIPKKVMGLGGPITIKRIPKLKHKGEKVAGLWRTYDRIIEINSSLPVREQRRTLYHELTHAALDDSGLHYTLSKDSQEVLCDLMASSRLQSEGI